MLKLVKNSASPETVKSLIEEASGQFAAAGIPSPRLDAELLLSRETGFDRAGLIRESDKTVSNDAAGRFRRNVARRKAWEPMAYILGEKEFFGRMFKVTTDVLIPRPDTETAVETLLTVLPRYAAVLDIGTGSGAIAITVAAERPDARVTGTDISPAAIEIAEENARRLGVKSRVSFLLCDLFPNGSFRFDALISNPPYVGDTDDLPPNVVKYEPALALFAGPDGLNLIRRILAQAKDRLVPGAPIVIEIGDTQGDAVKQLACEDGYEKVEILKDLSGRDRVLRCLAPLAAQKGRSGRG